MSQTSEAKPATVSGVITQIGITLRNGINTTEWGSKEFSIADNQGHILYFAENPD